MHFLIRGLLIPFVGASFTAMVLAAPPMAAREWTSTAGTKIHAEARSLENGTVELVAGQRVMRVPLSSLTAADQAVLQKHFAAAPPSLSQPTGKAVGPIRAAESWLPGVITIRAPAARIRISTRAHNETASADGTARS